MLKPYMREEALYYAMRWALGRNPAYSDFSRMGGDCTNFISQCLYAGGMDMNFTPTFGWYYFDLNHRAPAWTGVEYFYNFLMRTERTTGPVAQELPLCQLLPADVVQLSFDGERYAHTLLVLTNTACGITVAAHDYDTFGRNLNSYRYQAVRGLHILGSERG